MVTSPSPLLEPGWVEGSVDRDGVSIHYTRTGRDLPALVLAHGFTDTGLCWSRVARALQDRFDVVMVDARNHGRSGTGPGDPPQLAADVAAVVDGLGFERVDLMGHSIGARTMASVAAQRPGVVRRLVLEDPPWRADAEPADESPARLDRVRDYVRSLGAMTEAELRDLASEQHGNWDDSEYPAWIEGKQLLRPESADSLQLTDWRSIAARIVTPTLLIRGDDERGGIVTEAVAAEARGLSSSITDVAIAHAGHNIRRENPQAFLAAVREFLAD